MSQRRHASSKHPKGFEPPAPEDLLELRERVQEFTRREIPEELAAEVDKSNSFPNEMWQKLGDAGFLGITADEDVGGLGMGYQAHCVVMEEISRYCNPMWTTLVAATQPKAQGERFNWTELWRAFSAVRQSVAAQWQPAAETKILTWAGFWGKSRCPGHV